MTKNEIIARITELGVLLQRELNTKGTVAELELVLREAEAEYAALSDTEGDTPPPGNTVLTPTSAPVQPEGTGTLVRVKTRVSLHLNALHETRDTIVKIVHPGTVVRIQPALAIELSSLNYVELQD